MREAECNGVRGKSFSKKSVDITEAWQPICSLPDAVTETLGAMAASAHPTASGGAPEWGRQIRALRGKDPALWESPAGEKC